MVPSVNVVVVNQAAEVLLIRRSDNDNRALPGGAVDLGESVSQAAVRETREETGIDCEATDLLGIYSDPKVHDPLHQRRRGAPGVLARGDRAAPGRVAHHQFRIP